MWGAVTVVLLSSTATIANKYARLGPPRLYGELDSFNGERVPLALLSNKTTPSNDNIAGGSA